MRFRILLALVAMLVFGMTGVAAATDDETGTLVFQHNIEGGPEVEVVVYANQEDVETSLGKASPGDEIKDDLPVGTHDLVLFLGPDFEEAVAETAFDIAAGYTTTVEATLVEGEPALVAGHPKPGPKPEPSPSASASPTATATDDDDDDDDDGIEKPDRVETGAGGTSDGGSGAGIALLAGVAALSSAVVALRVRRRSA